MLGWSRLVSLGWQARIPLAEGLTRTGALLHEQLSDELVRLSVKPTLIFCFAAI